MVSFIIWNAEKGREVEGEYRSSLSHWYLYSLNRLIAKEVDVLVLY